MEVRLQLGWLGSICEKWWLIKATCHSGLQFRKDTKDLERYVPCLPCPLHATGFDRSPNRGTWMVTGKKLSACSRMLPADRLLTLTLNLAEPILVAVDGWKMKWCLHPSCWIWGALLKPSKIIWNSDYDFCMFEINVVDSKSASKIHMHKVKSFCRRSVEKPNGLFLLKIHLSPIEFIPWLRQSDAV